jgi:UDP-GlcNAc:undecaprenyl-phosphate/decaprenyl-phosphate GlcNAc-1-phosphate transferase
MWSLTPLFAAFLLAAAGTVVVRAIARRYGLVVAPREDRWHTRPTALYGGVAIAIGGVSAILALGGPALSGHAAAPAIVGAAAFLFAVGLVDDARGMGPVGKFILQLGAATLLIVLGVVYPLTPWNPVNGLITLFWFVGIVNALNLLDNMDGVTAGVAAVAALGFAVLYAAAGDPVLALVALATAGAALGFLVFNFTPASIFMGDAGSLFLGGMLAGLGVAYPLANGSSGPVSLLIPALVLLVPILDTALVTVTRTLYNRPISMGGRDHSTHRLVAMGFTEARAALFLYGFGATAFGVAWAVGSMAPGVGLWLGIAFLTAALLFTGYLGRLHRYDDGRPDEELRRGVILRNVLLKRRGLVLLLDVGLFGVAWYGAFVLYFDGAIPRELGAVANGTLGVVIVLKLAAFHYFRVYRGVWDRMGLADMHRIVKATLLGGLLAMGTLFLVARGAGIPRMVFVLDLLLAGALATAARSSVGSLDRFRRRLQAGKGVPVLIYGAGPEADLALRVLDLQAEERFDVVGFIDGVEEVGTLIHGHPVLGPPDRLGATLAATGARYVILAAPVGNGARPGELADECAAAGAELVALTWALEAVDPSEGEDRTRRPVATAASPVT